MWGDIAIAFTIAFLATFMATPYTIKLAKKLGAVDTPKDERRINKVPMTRLRWTSCYIRFYSFSYLFINSNVTRRKNKLNGR